jgi:UDP-GlcNAc:undecaprenyl-phosphate GlcNAc-1-phosphate transferase
MLTGWDQRTLYLAAFFGTLLAVWLLTPLAATLARRYGILDHPKDDRFHEAATPYLGGLAVAAGLVLVGAFAASSSGQLATIVVCGVVITAVGLLDDQRGVGPIVKIVIEAGAGIALFLVGVKAALFGHLWIDVPVTVLWVVAVTNATNLLDNMDGLATGSSAISALAFFVIAAGHGDYLVGAFAASVAGACFGFLRHNFPPAKIFLGDAGSLLLGFLLAAVALKMDLIGTPGIVRAAIPVLILGVPLLDMLLVVISRLREHRPVYKGGTDHTSHRLAARGVSGRSIALLIFAIQVLLCSVAVLLSHISDDTVVLGVVVAAAVAAAVVLLKLLAMAPLPTNGHGLAGYALDLGGSAEVGQSEVAFGDDALGGLGPVDA